MSGWITRTACTNIVAMSTSHKLKIGVIASSGGGVFKELCRLREQADFFVVTDRACGIEDVCRENQITFLRIEEPDNRLFSERTAQYLQERGPLDCVLLFFTRFITSEVFNRFPTINIHPSLLPAFPGLSPIGQAIKGQVKFIGATMHFIDNTPDGGAIVAQTVSSISHRDKQYLGKLSFLQKTMLSYLLIDLLMLGEISWHQGVGEVKRQLTQGVNCNPPLTDPNLRKIFQDIEHENGMVIL